MVGLVVKTGRVRGALLIKDVGARERRLESTSERLASINLID